MLTVNISRKELQSRGACASGIDQLLVIAKLQGRKYSVRVRDWTPLHDVWLAKALPAFSRWLRDTSLVPIPNLRGADLRRADLHGADLAGVDLTGVYRNSDDPPVPGWRVVDGRMTKAADQ